ncbi:MAG: bifunctional DNA primase/polymerase, partial [Candidatus Promineifilaceae bacterium]
MSRPSRLNPAALPVFAGQLHAWGANVTAILPGSKRPGHKWQAWQSRPQTAAEVAGLPWAEAAALGILNGPGGWRAFDLDAARGDGGQPAGPVSRDVLTALLEALGLEPDYAWAYASGSGAGWGVVVRCLEKLPAGWGRDSGVYRGRPRPGLALAFGGLELRWSRGQTIIMGAHPSGPGYRWLTGRPSDAPPPLLPAAAVAQAFDALAEPIAPAEEAAPLPPLAVQAEDPPRSLRQAARALQTT